MFSWCFRTFVGPLLGGVVVLWESFKGRGQGHVLYSGPTTATTLVAEVSSPGDEPKKVKKGSITPGLAPP